jgi:hypothetical protein
MKIPWRAVWKIAGLAVALLLVLGLILPLFPADRYGRRLQGSLERALGRRVEFGTVRFNLFRGPGFSVDNVVIDEDPSIGYEPIAYVPRMVIAPSLWSLLGGRFVIASIRLEDADGSSPVINLAKTGPASEPGRWNFSSLVKRSVLSTVPAIHVRNGRINFKFGNTKSIFYLMDTDLDIGPPGSLRGGWKVFCEAQAARTDRQAFGLGGFRLEGKWYVAPEHVDLDLRLDQARLAELTALVRGQAGGIHGVISSRLHLAGPLDAVGILGRMTIEDVHRWDLMPTQGSGWPLDIRGRLNLIAQQLELQSTTSLVPVTVRFRASDYLSQPHWAAAVTWNRFPTAPILELARHMGAQLPPRLDLSGTIDGAISYSGQAGLQGQVALHDAAVTIPDSPPVRFDVAYITMDHGHVRVSPAVVHTAEQDEAVLKADYAFDPGTLDLVISTGSMKVASLRAQAALAAVPWLEQMSSGEWSGQLQYHLEPGEAGWSGNLEIADATVNVPGLADALQIESAHARIDGARVVLDHLEAQAGPIAFDGEYRYEPGAARPHRIRLRAGEVRAEDLESELLPILRRNPGLLARALGRTETPDWLRRLNLEGSVQIEDLQVAGAHLENVRAGLLWDATHASLQGIEARFNRAALSGALAVNLRGAVPAYQFRGKLSGLNWQSGKLDASGTFQTSGTGLRLLANLKSEGTFSGTGLDFGTLAPWHAASGAYALAWAQTAPRLRLTDLRLQTEDETYTGRGATQDDGRLLIQLTNGLREMRMSGGLASLKVDESARP